MKKDSWYYASSNKNKTVIIYFYWKNLVHWIVSTCTPFHVIFIHLSGNLTHPPHASSEDGNYDSWVSPTAAYLPITDTNPSMIAKQNKWAAVNTPTFSIYGSDDNLRLFFTKFYFLNVFRYFPDETCFKIVTGGRICNSWMVPNQIIFHSESNGFLFKSNVFFSNK